MEKDRKGEEKISPNSPEFVVLGIVIFKRINIIQVSTCTSLLQMSICSTDSWWLPTPGLTHAQQVLYR